VYPFSEPRTVDLDALDRYAFPHSRLEVTEAQLLGV